jgi:hypothetical protein
MAGESAHYDIRIRVFDKPLDDLEKKTDRFEKKIGGVGGAFSKVFAGAAVLTGVGLLTKKIVGLGAEMEQTRVSFTTMLGSADKANNTLKELTKFAIATPFRQGEVVTGAKQLLAYGFAAEGLTGNLRMLGDVASGLSIPLGDLVYLYGTVRTQGRAMTKDIMQFANRGIPMYDALNKITGKYGQSLNKAIENGEITFGVIEKAFKKMTEEGSMFGGLMEKQAKTLSGRWSTFLDVLENTGRSIGERLNPTLGRLLDNVSGMLKSFDSIASKSEAQKEFNRGLTSLVERYDQLQAKLIRTADESKELKAITKSIGDLLPTAVSKWDDYGNAIGLTNDKLRENIRLSATKELELNREATSTTFNSLAKMAKDIQMQSMSLKSGRSRGAFEGTEGHAMTSDDKRLLQENLDALHQDLKNTYKTYVGLTGQIGNKKLEKAFKDAGLGEVYRNLLKSEVESRAAGVLTKGATTPGGDTATGTSGGGSTKAGIEKISSATRNITLNITKLVETLNFTKDSARNEYDMEEMVKRVLLRAVNDVNLVQ